MYMKHNIAEIEAKKMYQYRQNHHSISELGLLIRGKYKYFFHNYINLEERHAELFIVGYDRSVVSLEIHTRIYVHVLTTKRFVFAEHASCTLVFYIAYRIYQCIVVGNFFTL